MTILKDRTRLTDLLCKIINLKKDKNIRYKSERIINNGRNSKSKKAKHETLFPV